jgi:hypothetical protein
MLLNINNKLVDIKDSDVLYNLYYKLATLPTKKLLKNKKSNIDKYLSELKIQISKLDNLIPLYDIFSKNIYLIKPEEIYDSVIHLYYRPLTKKLYEYLQSIKTDDKTYKEKLEKNINFMENFDLNVLEETYIKTFYYQSNKIGKNFTLCIKPSFLPFVNINPYYNRDELINLGLNLKIIKPDETYYDEKRLLQLCDKVSQDDIDSDTLLNHYLFIQFNNLQYYIKYYSFMGSYQMNYYIRNNSVKDKFIEKNINQFHSIISKSPGFNDTYYVYRLINNDDFLQDVKIGGIFEDKSFMSTSRNPFYNPVRNAFGLILMKIKLPKNKQGVGLCIENYSLFPEEQEIILNPCRLKLVSKDDTIYYHTDKKAQRSIKTKYEFVYVEPIPLDINKISKNYDSELDIPIIDLYNTKIAGVKVEDKLNNFSNLLPLINTCKRFYVEVNKKQYLFSVNKMADKRIYEKFFFLQKKKYSENDIIEELYITYQDESTGEILLMIEIKDVISVNYLQKFTGCNKEFNDNDLLELISGFSKLFQLYQVVIHPNYKPFSTFINIKPEEYHYVIDNITDYHQVQKLSANIKIFNNDLMNYLIMKKNRFESINVKMNFKKGLLDKLKNIKVKEVFNEENYEIYSLIKKESLANLNELIIFFYKNYFYLLDKIITQINKYFDNELILNNLYYVFNSGTYLFEKQIISYAITDDTDLLSNYLTKLDTYKVRELR